LSVNVPFIIYLLKRSDRY